MVVVAEGVVGYQPASPVGRRSIGECRHEHRLRAVEEQARVAADVGIARQIVHAGVCSSGNPVVVEGGVGIVEGFESHECGGTGAGVARGSDDGVDPATLAGA